MNNVSVSISDFLTTSRGQPEAAKYSSCKHEMQLTEAKLEENVDWC